MDISSTTSSTRPLRHAVFPHCPFDRKKLALDAASRAMKMRRRLGIGLHEVICPFDIAQSLGIDVRLHNVPTMEGMYCQMRNRPPLIVLASERPAGRQRYTCGHELGHHEYGHGVRLDELLDDAALQALSQTQGHRHRYSDPDEYLVDRFAGFLLMPKSAVDRAFAKRNKKPETAEPHEIYIIACYLGVGYRTLIEHLCFSLNCISRGRLESLRQWATRLPNLRKAIAGQTVRHIVVVDDAWENSTIDVLTGDVIHIPHGWVAEGDGMEPIGTSPSDYWPSGEMIRVTRQGIGAITTTDGRQISLRVSRRGFTGLARYRYLDDPDEEMDEGGAL
jgi:Zn-dependent peptidase ImmA (M78 family)